MFWRNPQARDRFDREAHAVAALNHPHSPRFTMWVTPPNGHLLQPFIQEFVRRSSDSRGERRMGLGVWSAIARFHEIASA